MRQNWHEEAYLGRTRLALRRLGRLRILLVYGLGSFFYLGIKIPWRTPLQVATKYG
jgi:hypothetical protein